MPDDAIFLSVAFCSYKYNPVFYIESVVVTTKNYHNLEILLIYDDHGKVVHRNLHRIFYRYGFYNAIGEVKSAIGYVAINYIIPPAK
jgi:dTDP-4-amino-4,6-dideoxygalactose transaminase